MRNEKAKRDKIRRSMIVSDIYWQLGHINAYSLGSTKEKEIEHCIRKISEHLFELKVLPF